MIVSGDALAYRRVVARYRWAEAFALLKKSKGAFLAEAVPGHQVFVRCSGKAAAAIDHLSSTAPPGLGTCASKPLPAAPPEPTRAWLAADPLEVAFRRARAEAKARAQVA